MHVIRKAASGRIALALAAGLFATCIADTAFAQQEPNQDTLNTRLFGDLFKFPNSRTSLSGPSGRESLDESTNLEDNRGRVNRYEYKGRDTILFRETWTDERGETQGRIGVGRRF